MNKLRLLKSLLVVAMCLVGSMSAWAETTTYDFEDGNARFTAYNSGKITVSTIADPRDATKKVASFAYKAKGAHNFAYLNFSDLAENAATVRVEFDFYVTTASGHDLISLSDANFHTGALAGFDSNSNTGYGSYGTIFDLGCYRSSGTNYFVINNTKADGTYSFLGQWCHADITVNNVVKTVTYTITNASSQEVTASGVSFYNRFAGKCTQIDVYMGATSSGTPIYLDNLSITPTVSSSYDYTINAVSGGTTLKLLADGVATSGGNYSVSNLPKVIKYSDKYYVLDDNTVTGYTTQSYTMGAAKETKEIKYTLDETMVYYTEGETAFGESAINSAYSEGAYTNYAKSKTISTTIASAGAYRMETYVAARGAYKLFVYNSSDEEIVRIAPGVGAFTGEANSSNFTLTAGATIKIGAKSENSLSFDYVMIRKAPVAYTVEYKCGATTIKTADASRTAVWGTYATLPSTDKENIEYDGHLYRYTSDDASSQEIASDGTTVITVNFEDLGSVATITYTLNVGSSANTTIKSSVSTTDGTNITGIDIDQTSAGANATGAGDDRTAKLAIKTGANGETFDSPTNYVLFKYSVASGKKFTPTNISIKVANVGSTSANDIKYKATLSDGVKEISGTYIVTTQDGTVEDFIISNEGNVGFTGDITLKLWAWQIGSSNASAFRMGTPVTITGIVGDMTAVEIAIANCRKYETSDAFATYINGGTYASVEEVYAAHTAWQVENGTPSKAILNNTVTSADHFWGTLTDDADYEGAPDTKYLTNTAGSDYNVNQTVYQLPAGVYRASAWTYSSIAGWRKIYVSNVESSPWADLITPDTSDEGWVELSGEFTLTEPANIAFGLYASAVENRTAGFDNWTLTKIESVSKSISAAGWATYCSPYALDLANATGLTDAFIITGGDGSALTKTSVKGGTVPANTGLLLKAPEGTATIPVVASSETNVTGNKLVGVTANTEIAAEAGYVLMNDATNGLAFYKNANAFTVGAYTAYLPADFDANGARPFYSFSGDDATGVQELKNSSIEGLTSYYDLQGRRVAQPKKGLYIVNGKKVVVK